MRWHSAMTSTSTSTSARAALHNLSGYFMFDGVIWALYFLAFSIFATSYNNYKEKIAKNIFIFVRQCVFFCFVAFVSFCFVLFCVYATARLAS